MSEMHLRQPGFTIVLVDYLLKTKEEHKKFKETVDSRCIYKKGTR